MPGIAPDCFWYPDGKRWLFSSLSTEDGGTEEDAALLRGIWRMASCCFGPFGDRFLMGQQPMPARGGNIVWQICSVNGAWFPVRLLRKGAGGLGFTADEMGSTVH